MSSTQTPASGTTVTPGEVTAPSGGPALDPAVFDYFTGNDAVFVEGSPGSSLIKNSHPLVVFPSAKTASADFQGVRYKWATPPSGNILVRVLWAATAVVGSTNWQLAFERDDALGVDLNVSSFAAVKTVLSPAPPVLGELREASITFSPAEYDGVLAGEAYRLRVTRSGGVAPDTLVGDAQLFRVIMGAVP